MIRKILATIILILMIQTVNVRGAVATFDTLSEGFYGLHLSDGGILFFGGDARVNPISVAAPIGIDDVGGLFALQKELLPHFSSPNILTLGSLGVGTNAGGGGRFGSLLMTTEFIETSASLDVFFFPDADLVGNRILLEALKNGTVVQRDSVDVLGSGRRHATLQVDGVAFDTLRISGTGPAENGVFFGGIDNVRIVPEPGTLWMYLFMGNIVTICWLPRRRLA